LNEVASNENLSAAGESCIRVTYLQAKAYHKLTNSQVAYNSQILLIASRYI